MTTIEDLDLLSCSGDIDAYLIKTAVSVFED